MKSSDTLALNRLWEGQAEAGLSSSLSRQEERTATCLAREREEPLVRLARAKVGQGGTGAGRHRGRVQPILRAPWAVEGGTGCCSPWRGGRRGRPGGAHCWGGRRGGSRGHSGQGWPPEGGSRWGLIMLLLLLLLLPRDCGWQ